MLRRGKKAAPIAYLSLFPLRSHGISRRGSREPKEWGLWPGSAVWARPGEALQPYLVLDLR